MVRRITPSDLRNLLRSFDDRERPEGMLAFLNACQTAEAGQTGSFLEVLHSFGFTGAIATEQQTIDNFANELGLAFLQGFLKEGRPLGELLHGLRLKMAPLGLLYGAHCPPEIRVRRSAMRADESDRPSTTGPGCRSHAQGPGPARRRQASRSRWSCRQNLTVLWVISMGRSGPVHGPRADIVRFAATLDEPTRES